MAGGSFVRSCIFWSLAAMRLAARRWRVDWIGHTCRGEWKDQNTCLDSGLSEGSPCEDDPQKHRKCALYLYKVEDAWYLGQTICFLWQNFLSVKHSIFSTAGAFVVILVQGVSPIQSIQSITQHHPTMQHFADCSSAHSNSVLTFPNNIHRHECYCSAV